MEHVVGLIEYRAGNLFSIENAFRNLDVEVRRIRRPTDFDGLSHVVLPGVGAFGHCRRSLDASGMEPRLIDWAMVERRPTLGICVGMQLMAEAGLEYGRTEGLGWFQGEIAPIPANPPAVRVPHVGWNAIDLTAQVGALQPHHKIDVYFDHSFALLDPDPSDVAAWCDHGLPFAAILANGNVMATQFHPEKSQRAGLRILSAFLGLGDG